jgi:hypothetical protein
VTWPWSGSDHGLVSSFPSCLGRSLRRLGPLAVGVAICLAFAGCGTGYRSHREVIAAVDATLAAPSFTLSTDAKLTTGTLQSRLIASGSIDFPQLIADMTISVESGNQKGESETRANGTTVWVRADNDGVNELDLPDGKRWVEGGTEQLTEVQIFQQGTRGLLGVLLTLRAAEATETIGTDNLDDTEVTRYRTSVTYEDAVEAAGPDSDALEQALSLDAPTPVNLTIDVAIGSDGVIREFVLITESDADSTGPAVDYRLSLTDVGLDVDAPEPPPRDETVTGTQAEALFDGLGD